MSADLTDFSQFSEAFAALDRPERRLAERVADESRKADQVDKLDADLTRLEIDQKNRSHAVAFSCGMGCMVREFEGGEDAKA